MKMKHSHIIQKFELRKVGAAADLMFTLSHLLIFLLLIGENSDTIEVKIDSDCMLDNW